MRVAENYFAGHDDLAKHIANQNPKKGIAYQVPARIVISRPSDDSVSVARAAGTCTLAISTSPRADPSFGIISRPD